MKKEIASFWSLTARATLPITLLAADEYEEGRRVTLAAVEDNPKKEIRYRPTVCVD